MVRRNGHRELIAARTGGRKQVTHHEVTADITA